MDTFFGLPSHPLLVHGVTVLLPLAALGAVVIAFSPAWRERIGWVVVGIAGVGLVFTYLAKESGEALEEYIEDTEGISSTLHAHTELGDVFLFWAIPLFLAVLGFMLYARYRKQHGMPELRLGSPLALALVGLVIVASAATTYKTVEVGHSGAKAAWEDVDVSKLGEGGEESEEEGEESEELEGMGIPGAVTAPVAR